MPPTSDPVYLAAACNDGYAMSLAVMLSSIGATLAPGRKVVAFVLESDLSPATKAKVARSIDERPIEIVWQTVDPAPLAALRDGLRAFDWFTVEIYYRLLLPDLLPTGIDKVIYLDCDVVLNHDLGELWDIEIGEAYVLAVPEADPGARLVSSPKGIAFYRALGLAPDLKYFNSGVLVVNLRRWRQDCLPLRVVTYLREAGDDVLWYDQEALNAAMAGEWTELDPRWNLMVHFERRSSGTGSPMPFIVHFNGSSKPWHADFPHRFGDLFFEHLDRTAWAGWRPRPQALVSARRFARLAIKAVRKRRHALARHLCRGRQRWHAWQVLRRPLRRLDRNPIPPAGQVEIRLFVVGGSPGPCLPGLLDLHFRNGCDRAFLALRLTDREAASLTESHPQAHALARAEDPRSDHEVLRHLLHAYGQGHWCLIVGANELLVAANVAARPLKELCARLEAGGFEALRCQVIDREGDPASIDRGSSPEPVIAPPVEGDPRRIATVARDSLTGRVFGALVEVASDAPSPTGAAQPRARVVLLKFRAEMALATDLRAVDGARDADTRGIVLRFRDPTAPRPRDHDPGGDQEGIGRGRAG